jgi:hypothetical protein
MAVAVGAGRVGQVLLAGEHEGPFRYPAGGDGPFGGGALRPGAAEVDGPGPAAGLVGQGDTGPGRPHRPGLDGPSRLFLRLERVHEARDLLGLGSFRGRQAHLR